MSASGYALPPFIIFEKSYPSGPYGRLGPDNALYGTSPNGYMDAELFRNWIDKLFVPRTHHIPKPLLLILDGHGSHMDINMIDSLVEQDIHLFCLPPHTTNILQPLDVAIFKPLKTYFSKLTDFATLASLGEKNRVTICKKNFTAIFKQAYNEKLNVALIQTGFRKCGISPFNPDAIDKKRLMPSDVTIKTGTLASSVPSEDSSDDIRLNITPVTERSTVSVDDNPFPSLPGAAPSVPLVDLSGNACSSTPNQRKKPNPLLSVIPASLVDSLIIPKTPEKKERNIRVVTKARVLTSNEQRKLFREKVENKKAEEEAKKKRKLERERKKKEKEQNVRQTSTKKENRPPGKRMIQPRKKKKVQQESEEELDVESETEEEIVLSSDESDGNKKEQNAPETPIQQESQRPTRNKAKKVQQESDKELESDSETEDIVLSSDESECESDSDDDFNIETHCFICQRKNPPKELLTKGKINWIGCDAAEHWVHDVCSRASTEELKAESFVCFRCKTLE